MFIVEKGDLSVYLPEPRPSSKMAPAPSSSSSSSSSRRLGKAPAAVGAGGPADTRHSGSGKSESSAGDGDSDAFVGREEKGLGADGWKRRRHGKLVRHYTAGDFFGERSLLLDKPRGATIVADSPARLIKVTKNLFASVAFSVKGLLISAVR